MPPKTLGGVCELEECGKTFVGRVDATFCSKRCRDRRRYLWRRGIPE